MGKRQNISCERGQAAIFLTISLPVLFGLLGLVVDVGWAYWRHEAAKTAAAAAVSATVAAAGSSTPATQASTGCPSTLNTTLAWEVGCDFAVKNGFTNGVNGRSVAIQIGSGSTGIPVSGVTPSGYWVGATVTESIPTLFSYVIGDSSFRVAAHATVAVYPGGPAGCIYVLDKNNDGTTQNTAMTVTGGSGTTGCGFYVNGSNVASFNMTGGSVDFGTSLGKVNLQAASTSNWPPSGGSILPAPASGDMSWGNAAITSPLSGLPTPTAGTCLTAPSALGGGADFIQTSGTYTYQPGTYCGTTGIQIKGGTASFASGLYIMTAGSVKISNGSPAVDATSGVTFYFGPNAGTLTVTGNGLNLKAPSGGSCSGTSGCDGIAVMKPALPSGTASESWDWSGGLININGVVDMPFCKMKYTGGTSAVALTMIVDTFTLTGGHIDGPATSKYLTGTALGSGTGKSYFVE